MNKDKNMYYLPKEKLKRLLRLDADVRESLLKKYSGFNELLPPGTLDLLSAVTALSSPDAA